MSTEKFQDPMTTAKGETRAWVDLVSLDTLWFNTGTLCNLSCENCYIESTPTNDRLSYLEVDDVTCYLDEIRELKLPTRQISFTGGEPFLNPNIIKILEEGLKRDFPVLVLTNAYKVIKRWEKPLNELREIYGDKLKLRISLDHYTREVHEKERGLGTFDETLANAKRLWDQGFSLSIAGRSLTDETQEDAISGYQKLMEEREIGLNLLPDKIVIFPEMDTPKEVPEITTSCWDILNKTPEQQMCAKERMIIKRKGESSPVILPCTLLAYDKQFELGHSLKDAKKRVQLNHRFCAEFCVLGGASCSATS